MGSEMGSETGSEMGSEMSLYFGQMYWDIYRIRLITTPGFYFSKWIFGWGLFKKSSKDMTFFNKSWGLFKKRLKQLEQLKRHECLKQLKQLKWLKLLKQWKIFIYSIDVITALGFYFSKWIFGWGSFWIFNWFFPSSS